MIEKSKLVAASGILYTLNNIVEFPYEKGKMVFDTISLSKEMESFDALSVNILVPNLGTSLREMAIAEDWLNPDQQTTSIIAESILDMPPPYRTASEILSLQRAMPLYVKLPQSIYPEVERVERFDGTGNELFEKLSEEFYQLTYGVDETDRKIIYAE